MCPNYDAAFTLPKKAEDYSLWEFSGVLMSKERALRSSPDASLVFETRFVLISAPINHQNYYPT
jgi:hypothetical protein